MLPILSLGDVQLPTYFLFISMGFCLAAFYLYKRAEKADASTAIALDFGLCLMVGSFIGSRLFHVFYEAPEYYFEEPLAVFWIWQGGFVFYGGLLGALICGTLYLKIKKQNLLEWLDLLAPVFPPVYALGRFATLLSGSGYGKPTSLPWGIVYPAGSEAPAGVALHPTPIYSILWSLGLWAVLLYIEHRAKTSRLERPPGSLFWITVMGYSLGRMVIEQFRNDPRGATFLSLSISTWISLLVFFSALILSVKTSRKFSSQRS